MSDIRNITLAFPCQEKLEQNAAGGFYCHKCAHAITDFRCQSAEALQEAIRQAGTKPVCGIFKASQLSERFARYAAVATITITATSASMCSPAGGKTATGSKATSENETIASNPAETSSDSSQSVEFVTTGIIARPPVNTSYNPAKLQTEIMRGLNRHPDGLDVPLQVAMEVTIDTQGKVTNVTSYSVDPLPEALMQEAVRAVRAANYPFKPMIISGQAMESIATVTLMFGDEKDYVPR